MTIDLILLILILLNILVVCEVDQLRIRWTQLHQKRLDRLEEQINLLGQKDNWND